MKISEIVQVPGPVKPAPAPHAPKSKLNGAFSPVQVAIDARKPASIVSVMPWLTGRLIGTLP